MKLKLHEKEWQLDNKVLGNIHVLLPGMAFSSRITGLISKASMYVVLGQIEEARKINAHIDSEEYDWSFDTQQLVFSYQDGEWVESLPSFKGRGYRIDMHPDEANKPPGEALHREASYILVIRREYGRTDKEEWDETQAVLFV